MHKSIVVLILVAVSAFSVIPGQARAATQLSEILLLPEETPVRIEIPETEQEIDILSIRAISADTRIIAETPVKILCPDLRVVEVLSGENFVCPPPEPDVILIVEVPPPPPWLQPLGPMRGEELANLTAEEQARLQQTDHEIGLLPVNDEQKLFLRVNLYASLYLYSETQRIFKEYPEPVTEPATLRLRARIYWEEGDLRRAYQYFSLALERSESLDDTEGRALALHSLALLLKASGEKETAGQKAQEAQQAYAELGYTLTTEQLLQQESRK